MFVFEGMRNLNLIASTLVVSLIGVVSVESVGPAILGLGGVAIYYLRKSNLSENAR